MSVHLCLMIVLVPPEIWWTLAEKFWFCQKVQLNDIGTQITIVVLRLVRRINSKLLIPIEIFSTKYSFVHFHSFKCRNVFPGNITATSEIYLPNDVNFLQFHRYLDPSDWHCTAPRLPIIFLDIISYAFSESMKVTCISMFSPYFFL